MAVDEGGGVAGEKKCCLGAAARTRDLAYRALKGRHRAAIDDGMRSGLGERPGNFQPSPPPVISATRPFRENLSKMLISSSC
jgi:hypothetical protein